MLGTQSAIIPKTPVFIVQHNPVKRYKVFKCRMTVNTVQFGCGFWSYEKHLKTLGGTVPYPTSGEQCEKVVSSRLFTTENHDKFPLQIPGFQPSESPNLVIPE